MTRSRSSALASSIVVLVSTLIVGCFAWAQSPGGAPNPGTPDPIRANGWRARTSGSNLTLYDSANNAGTVFADAGTTMNIVADGALYFNDSCVSLYESGTNDLQLLADCFIALTLSASGGNSRLALDGSATIETDNGTSLVFSDGSNTLATIADAGTTGALTTGALTASVAASGVTVSSTWELKQAGGAPILQGYGAGMYFRNVNGTDFTFDDATNNLAKVFDEGTTGSVGSSSGRFRSFTESNTYVAVEETEDVIEGVINGVQEFQITPTGIVATDLVTTPSISFSSGATYKAVKYSAVIDLGNIASDACEIASIDTADTADVDDDCFSNKPATLDYLASSTTCYYSGTRIELRVCNWSSVARDPASATYTCTCNED